MNGSFTHAHTNRTTNSFSNFELELRLFSSAVFAGPSRQPTGVGERYSRANNSRIL
jgi:hypothetical protein